MAAPAANPYQTQAVDKSLIIIGGWRDNTPKEVINLDVAKFLALFNATGHACELEEIRCPTRAKFASLVFKEGGTEGTSAKQAFAFTGWLRSLAVKPVCVGSGAPAWAVITQSVEDRTRSKTIKRGLRCLHLLREELNVPAKILDLGYEVSLLEGKFKGRDTGILVGGLKAASYDAVTDTLSWEWKVLKESVLGLEKDKLEKKWKEVGGPAVES